MAPWIDHEAEGRVVEKSEALMKALFKGLPELVDTEGIGENLGDEIVFKKWWERRLKTLPYAKVSPSTHYIGKWLNSFVPQDQDRRLLVVRSPTLRKMVTGAIRQFDLTFLKKPSDVKDEEGDPDFDLNSVRAKLVKIEERWTNPLLAAERSIEDVMFIGELKSSLKDKPQAQRQLMSYTRELASIPGFLEFYGLVIAGPALFVYKFTPSATYITPKIYYKSNPQHLSRVLDTLILTLEPRRYCYALRPSIFSGPSQSIIRLPHDCTIKYFEKEDNIEKRFRNLGVIDLDPRFNGRMTNVFRVLYWQSGKEVRGVLKLSNIDCSVNGEEIRVYQSIGSASSEVKEHLAEAKAIWQGPESYGIDLGPNETPPPQATRRRFTAVLLKEEYLPISMIYHPRDLVKLVLHIVSGRYSFLILHYLSKYLILISNHRPGSIGLHPQRSQLWQYRCSAKGRKTRER